MSALGLACGSGADEPSGLRVDEREGALAVRRGTQLLLAYRHSATSGPPERGPLYTRSAYLHPVYAPCGAVVTGDFPADHPHQRGIFFAWTKTRLLHPAGALEPDFWNLGAGTGRVRCVQTYPVRDAAGRLLGLDALHAWEIHRGGEWEEALWETWQLRFPPASPELAAAHGAYYTFDVTSLQTPRFTLELPRYRYGGFSVRGSGKWVGKDSPMKVLTSEGKGRQTADDTPARWADMSGPVDGREVGIAALEHPANLGTPVRLRMPPEYPYYVFSAPRAADRRLEADREYRFRYRLVVHNGPADPGLLERLWRQLARE